MIAEYSVVADEVEAFLAGVSHSNVLCARIEGDELIDRDAAGASQTFVFDLSEGDDEIRGALKLIPIEGRAVFAVVDTDMTNSDLKRVDGDEILDARLEYVERIIRSKGAEFSRSEFKAFPMEKDAKALELGL